MVCRKLCISILFYQVELKKLDDKKTINKMMVFFITWLCGYWTITFDCKSCIGSLSIGLRIS